MVSRCLCLALLAASLVATVVAARPAHARGSLFDGDRLVHYRTHPKHADAPQVSVSVWDFVQVNRTVTCEQLPTPLPIVAPIGVCFLNPLAEYFGSVSLTEPVYGNWSILYIEPPTKDDPTPAIYFYMYADAECTQLVFGGAQASNSQCAANVNIIAPATGPWGPAPPAYPPQGWVAQNEYNDVFHCNVSSFSTSTLTPQGACVQNVDGTWQAMYCDAAGQNVTTVQFLNSTNANCAEPTQWMGTTITPPGCSTGNLLVCPAPGGPPPPVPPPAFGPTFSQVVSYAAAEERPTKQERTLVRRVFDEWAAPETCGVQVMNWFTTPLNQCQFSGFGQSAQAQIFACDGKQATVSTWTSNFDCSGKADQVQNIPLGECLGQDLFYVAITTCQLSEK